MAYLDCPPIYSEQVTRCLHPVMVRPDEEHVFPVPCGRCIACKMRKTKEWSLRLEMEARDYDFHDIQFVTLTYDNEHVPVAVTETEKFIVEVPSLCGRDVQLFLKRLRKTLDYPIRYYLVGEYGIRTQRPHYHAIVYGLKSEDSYKVARAWRQGFVLVKPFFNETTVYVAGYIQKKLYGKHVYKYEMPPFVRCSQKLGLSFCLRKDVLANIIADPDHCLYLNGYKRGLPRYIRRKLSEMGYLEPRSIDDVLGDYVEQSIDFEESLKKKNISYADWLLNEYANIERKFVKNNRKRNSNLEV